jgi:hypothetical protein
LSLSLSKQLTNFLGFNILIPVNLIHLSDNILKQKVEQISSNFADIINIDKTILRYQLNSEILLLKQSLKSTDQLLTSLEETLIYLNEDIYPTICLLIGIYLTFPVSVATAERSFSCFKRLKTYLRNRIGRKRLTGLALIYIHRDINLDINKIINFYARIPKEN